MSIPELKGSFAFHLAGETIVYTENPLHKFPELSSLKALSTNAETQGSRLKSGNTEDSLKICMRTRALPVNAASLSGPLHKSTINMEELILERNLMDVNNVEKPLFLPFSFEDMKRLIVEKA
ncbi:hypothetical protein AAY473_017320 [Plecturocebus cupreus]